MRTTVCLNYQLTMLILVLIFFCSVKQISACPFCDAQGFTLTQEKEDAAVVAFGELREIDASMRKINVLHVLKGDALLEAHKQITITSNVAGKVGEYVLMLGSKTDDPKKLEWKLQPFTDIAYAYLIKTPKSQLPYQERLKFFVNYLEHPDVIIAEDAYLEFGFAPYDVVEKISTLFTTNQLQTWLESETVPPKRKGLYGLLLGLVANQGNNPQAVTFLKELVLKPEEDFRAGFDGILGGYLIAAKEDGLKVIEDRFLKNPDSPVGDMRHSVNTLRFYWQYGKQIPQQQITSAMRHLLQRPEIAYEIIADLARWEDWKSTQAIFALYGKQGYDNKRTKQAIILFLLAAKTNEAKIALQTIKQKDPKLVAEVEAFSPFLGGEQ